MKERPILFSAAMVQAILDGKKTQTRRLCKTANEKAISFVVDCGQVIFGDEEGDVRFPCPYGQPGDRLWVRETYQYAGWDKNGGLPVIRYRADGAERQIEEIPSVDWADKLDVIFEKLFIESDDNTPVDRVWRPSIHMPRWASRIILEITGIRVERLQDISEEDAWAEGIEAVDGMLDDLKILEMAKRTCTPFDDGRPTFASIWESINGPGSWDKNPWVWVLEYRRIEA